MIWRNCTRLFGNFLNELSSIWLPTEELSSTNLNPSTSLLPNPTMVVFHPCISTLGRRVSRLACIISGHDLPLMPSNSLLINLPSKAAPPTPQKVRTAMKKQSLQPCNALWRTQSLVSAAAAKQRQPYSCGTRITIQKIHLFFLIARLIFSSLIFPFPHLHPQKQNPYLHSVHISLFQFYRNWIQ